MLTFFSRQSFIAVAAGCLIAFATSGAWAQQRTSQQGRMGATGNTGAQGIGTGGAGGGQIGAPTDSGPSGAVTGEISRSGDRVLSDVGTQTGTGVQGARGARGAAGGIGGVRGFGGTSPFGASPFGTNNTAAATPSVRTRLRADIQTPALSPLLSDARAMRQIVNTPLQRRVNGFSVSLTNGVATIAGTVNSQRDRRMAELVLRLEPGVRQINNQIVVSP